ncbi:uncharacterized protein LOC105159015 [Sesamum indicum]|uniref:Uncharacterized protein LOC105159015 n=1 Tax=Sesamum indicum TaxID=4182 RepID=A0A6I9SVF6_SESIN|nr:uncharacterized protein LOC105159015 [Sesamum indicum]
MEGLIPMVYKSIKKTTTRRRYECLSAGATQTQDFCTNDDDDDQYSFSKNKYFMTEGGRVPGSGGAHHRRWYSVDVRSFGPEDGACKPKQLVRFRSQRLFSCVSGA